MDRLSELPEEVIHLIFSKLEMRDVVRTTILSKRWVNIWTTVDCLNFEISTDDTNRNFIYGVIERWNGTKVKIFKIVVQDFCWLPLYDGDMSLWMSFAIERKVEELHVIVFYQVIILRDWNNDLLYFSPPQSLYSCSSIRKLTLIGCNVISSSNVRWGQLKSLLIDGGQLTEDMINLVISGSPQLETLRLIQWIRPHNLSIQSSTLKTLEISSRCLYPSNDTLLIWAPKLEELTICGPAYEKCLVTDPFSLTTVELGIRDERAELLGETLRQILLSIPYVKSVKLSFHCFQVLRMMLGGGGTPFPPFSNVKYLEFDCCSSHKLKDMVGILETFPMIERLRLMVDWSSAYYNYNVLFYDLQGVVDKAAPDFKNRGSFLPHLKTVDIVWANYDRSIFGTIASLLKHATEVRKIVIRNVAEWKDEDKYSRIEKNVASLQLSLPIVELTFYKASRMNEIPFYAYGEYQLS